MPQHELYVREDRVEDGHGPRIAQPPTGDLCHEAPTMQLPAQAARQLPDQSITLRVDSSSTDDSRLRGALP